ncbi:hypothetical protein [Marinomonas sp. PE14-40]|uniref:hypothetical protein n=1 Tax=Marinomonas sp. PE14-40 TaxID=3060621 RepID=UPI003F67FE47
MEIEVKVGVRFRQFQVSLSHSQLDQLGSVSRYVLVALAQEGVDWLQLVSVTTLDEFSLKPIRDRLIMLRYLDVGGQLTSLGRSMSQLLTLIESPQHVWVDECFSVRNNKVAILKDHTGLSKVEEGELDLLPPLRGINMVKEYSQVSRLKKAVDYWRMEEKLVSTLELLWSEASDMFSNYSILNEIDLEFKQLKETIVVPFTSTFSSEKVHSSWGLNSPALHCVRHASLDPSIPKFIPNLEDTPFIQSVCLLTGELIDDTHVSDDGDSNAFAEIEPLGEDKTQAWNVLHSKLEEIETVSYMNINLKFTEKYRSFYLPVSSFYDEIENDLDVFPVHKSSLRKQGAMQ